MYKYSKLALKIFLLTVIIPSSYWVIATYIYDPLQIWHKPYFREMTYGVNNRESNLAVIRNNDFDSIIIGNSLSSNTSAKEASKKLNAHFMNLSMDGADPVDNKFILDYALKQKKIKKVVYFLSLHYLPFRVKNDNYSTSNYSFLYDTNKYNDSRIYLNSKYSKCILTFSKSLECIGDKVDMDKPFAWDKMDIYMRRFGNFDKWIANKDIPQVQDAFKKVLETPLDIKPQKISNERKKEILDYLNKYILSIVKENTTTEFYFILPPTSSLELSRSIRSDDDINFENQKIALKYLVSQNNKYDNIKIYDFDSLNNLEKMKDYKDLMHYHPWVNSYIIDAVSKNKNILTTQNVDEYIAKTYKNALSVDFNYYFNKIKNATNN